MRVRASGVSTLLCTNARACALRSCCAVRAVLWCPRRHELPQLGADAGAPGRLWPGVYRKAFKPSPAHCPLPPPRPSLLRCCVRFEAAWLAGPVCVCPHACAHADCGLTTAVLWLVRLPPPQPPLLRPPPNHPLPPGLLLYSGHYMVRGTFSSSPPPLPPMYKTRGRELNRTHTSYVYRVMATPHPSVDWEAFGCVCARGGSKKAPRT